MEDNSDQTDLELGIALSLSQALLEEQTTKNSGTDNKPSSTEHCREHAHASGKSVPEPEYFSAGKLSDFF